MGCTWFYEDGAWHTVARGRAAHCGALSTGELPWMTAPPPRSHPVCADCVD